MNNIGAYSAVTATAATQATNGEDRRSSGKTVDGSISEAKVTERKSTDSLEISEEGANKASKSRAAQIAKAQTQDALERMIQQQLNIFRKTSTPGAKALKDVNFSDLENDDYYGIEATANRMFDNALRMSGGSPESMAQFKDLTERAYAEAEKKWGGNLPAICYKTRDKLYSKFDNYIASGGKTTEALNDSDE